MAYNTGGGASVNAAGFAAYSSGNLSNVTGDGTSYTIPFNTTTLDTASAFNTSTGVYTFPYSGLWLLTGTYSIFNLGAAHTLGLIQVVATGGTSTVIYSNPFVVSNGATVYQSFSTMIKVTAADTVSLNFQVVGGTKTVGVVGTLNGFTFSGALINT